MKNLRDLMFELALAVALGLLIGAVGFIIAVDLVWRYFI